MNRQRSIAFVLLLLFACKTTPILPRSPIPVPAGLAEEQIEIALLAAITGHAPAGLMRQANRPEGGGVEAVRAAALANRVPSGSGWYAELIESGEIWTTYYRGRHRLNVAIRYTQLEVRTEITGSEHLSQEDGQIHKNALEWMRDLEGRIEKSLEAVAILAQRQPSQGR